MIRNSAKYTALTLYSMELPLRTVWANIFLLDISCISISVLYFIIFSSFWYHIKMSYIFIIFLTHFTECICLFCCFYLDSIALHCHISQKIIERMWGVGGMYILLGINDFKCCRVIRIIWIFFFCLRWILL